MVCSSKGRATKMEKKKRRRRRRRGGGGGRGGRGGGGGGGGGVNPVDTPHNKINCHDKTRGVKKVLIRTTRSNREEMRSNAN